MKFIITENKLYETAIKWINKNYGDLEPYETEKYPDYIFFIKNKDVVFEYNKKNGVVIISYNKIWSFLEKIFSMEYEQIQEVTKLWVEEHYKLGVTTTLTVIHIGDKRVEEHYKLGVTTTLQMQVWPLVSVEEHYKLGVTTNNKPQLFDEDI
jgi:hypothetical protein